MHLESTTLNLYLDWPLAFLPILAVLVLMLRFRWGGAKAGAVGWLAALLVAGLRFGAGWQVLAYAQVKGLLLSRSCCTSSGPHCCFTASRTRPAR